MSTQRRVLRIERSTPTVEGAGVRLKRAFGRVDPKLDPFLLLDDFHSDDPSDYRAGFPWHPHRGIETITYLLHGDVAHGDSLGNRGVIGPGEVQWMTAGSGIIHEEMPVQGDGLLWGFQLWANLPASHKMMNPRYRDVKGEQIPEVEIDHGVRAKVICGEIGEVKGPVRDVVTNPSYLDLTLDPGTTFRHEIPGGFNVFAYVIGGQVLPWPHEQPVTGEHLVIFEDGDEIVLSAGDPGARFLLVAGRPIGEPVSWGGPIVMNTQEELEIAFEEYQNGTFIKHGRTR